MNSNIASEVTDSIGDFYSKMPPQMRRAVEQASSIIFSGGAAGAPQAIFAMMQDIPEFRLGTGGLNAGAVASMERSGMELGGLGA